MGMEAGVVLSGLLGSVVAGLGTGVGALAIYGRRKWDERSQTLMLAIAAGVMLAATVFSLLQPALEAAQVATGSARGAGLLVGAGLLLGALTIWGIHSLTPHEHFIKHEEHRPARLGRNWLFILAITLHNFPEGMSVGVSYGADHATGLAMTLGIGLQNIPEGLVVAAALAGDGFKRGYAFRVALLTGLVEPIGGLVGAVAVAASTLLLPWALAFAAGAMLYIISGEVIPETHRNGTEARSTFSLMAGFVGMMLLDLSLA